MKTLLLNNFFIGLILFTLSVFFAFACTCFIKFILYFAEAETGFWAIFKLLSSILFLLSLLALSVENFLTYKDIKNLEKEWKIPAREIVEGIYGNGIQNYYFGERENFLNDLEEARNKKI